ncbi:MAG: cytochrome d ubiquinol oxidase subunit II [Armatimonadota bacterium]
MTALQFIWFGLIAVLIVGYTVLDGFDLGVGIWYLTVRKEEVRRTLMSTIAPFWDGNEVWLLTAGGATFAAFPPVYATVFSGFYLALMLVLFVLILRAVSIEFRAREWDPKARARWDLAFGLGSTVAVLLFGVAFGNIMRGLPLDAQGNFTGTFFTLLNPFALLVGVLNIAMLATHGALYVALRTEGELAAQAKAWARSAWVAYLPLAVITITVAAIFQPHLLANYQEWPILWAVPALALTAIILAGAWSRQGKAGQAFAASSTGIALLLVSAAAGLFPTLVPALNNPAWNLTALNSSSSFLTLEVMLVIAVVGMAIVVGYTIWVYRTFGGKVTEDLHY